MKKKLLSPFDLALLILVVALVIGSRLLVHPQNTVLPQDTLTLEDEFRQTMQRYTDWDLYNTPENYNQTYVLQIVGDIANQPERWPQPEAYLHQKENQNSDVGQVVSCEASTDRFGNPALNVTIIDWCVYTRSRIVSEDYQFQYLLGEELTICDGAGNVLGTGTIISMN